MGAPRTVLLGSMEVPAAGGSPLSRTAEAVKLRRHWQYTHVSNDDGAGRLAADRTMANPSLDEDMAACTRGGTSILLRLLSLRSGNSPWFSAGILMLRNFLAESPRSMVTHVAAGGRRSTMSYGGTWRSLCLAGWPVRCSCADLGLVSATARWVVGNARYPLGRPQRPQSRQSGLSNSPDSAILGGPAKLNAMPT